MIKSLLYGTVSKGQKLEEHTMTSNNSLYTKAELQDLGMTVGDDVAIDRSVRFFGAENISIASHVRIDCFCLISAKEPVTIGNFIHIAAGCYLFGNAGIELEDYVGLSSRVSVYSVSDDYSEGHLANPLVPDELRKVNSAKVLIKKFSIVGSGTTILPGSILGTGSSVGALSLVNKSIPDYMIVSGTPLKKIGTRNREKIEELADRHKVFLANQR